MPLLSRSSCVSSDAPDRDVPGDAAHRRLRQALHDSLRGQAEAVLVCGERVIPAASLWAGSRVWVEWFRRQGLSAGDRVVLALEPSPAWLMVFIAAAWEGLTACPVAAGEARASLGSGPDSPVIERQLDARLVVADRLHAGPGWIAPDANGLPGQQVDGLRDAVSPPTAAARLLMRSSGTAVLCDRNTAPVVPPAGRWHAISDSNLLSVIESHRPKLGLGGARVLSILPWQHAFGLVIDLLPALFDRASCIVREPAGGRDPRAILRLAEAWHITHVSMVPLHVRRLARVSGGLELLRSLRGGVVGGAAVDRELAEVLRGTRLRVGYGQTEASPGVMLGEPGCWEAGCLGDAIGCTTRVDRDGHLLVRGPNVCVGRWRTPDEGGPGLEMLAGDRWLETGDLVTHGPRGMRFVGRLTDDFKLANGTLVHAGALERSVLLAVPSAGECVIYSSDGEGLEVLLVMPDHAGDDAVPQSTVERIASALGPLGARLTRVGFVGAHAVQRTPKGAIDRGAISAHAGSSAAVCQLSGSRV